MMKPQLPHPDQKWGSTTYAQHGDDLMILNLFSLIGKKDFKYLDIGCHHPYNISNTALLYERGHRGVNVDANANVIKLFRSERPEDKNICIGIGPVRGDFPFKMYDDFSGRNTFSDKEVNSLKETMTVQREVSLRVVTINDVVNKCCGNVWPELLTLDVEGWDLPILENATFSNGNKPLVICVETRKEIGWDMIRVVESYGYTVVCRMIENLFFVADQHLEDVRS
jgi:FkbM family methyltransferase